MSSSSVCHATGRPQQKCPPPPLSPARSHGPDKCVGIDDDPQAAGAARAHCVNHTPQKVPPLTFVTCSAVAHHRRWRTTLAALSNACICKCAPSLPGWARVAARVPSMDSKALQITIKARAARALYNTRKRGYVRDECKRSQSSKTFSLPWAFLWNHAAQQQGSLQRGARPQPHRE